jgi:hypothetical protein
VAFGVMAEWSGARLAVRRRRRYLENA